MQITFHGAAREVTGSKHLLEVNGKKILLDCGLFQGNRKQSAIKNQEVWSDFNQIDFVILSHAHIDHSGGLPFLVKNGFNGPIYSTPATKEISEFMLQDSAFIQAREVEFINKHQLGTPVEPLYDSEDVINTLSKFKTVDYENPIEICPGVTLTFKNAGHILGAAMVYLEIQDQADGKTKTLTFTGDLGRKEATLLQNPTAIKSTNYLIMESTYGNRFHKWIKDVDIKLAKLINETASRGGKIIVPAFALERTQEVVYHLHALQQAGKIPSLPIFVDSPLAVNVTEIFKKYLDHYKAEVQEEFKQKSPFAFDRLNYVRTAEESKKLNTKQGPMVIIAASGMCEFGRILHHIRNNIEDPKNLILIVGYQAEHTLGRKLLDQEKQVRIFGENRRVKAQVEVLDAFSGHADRSDLIDFVTQIDEDSLQKIFLVHGEESQGLTFSKILAEIKPKSEVFLPAVKQSFHL